MQLMEKHGETALSEEDFEELTDIIMTVSESKLSTWEKNFVNDMQENIEKWGQQVRISEKQWAILRRLRDAAN